jgi:single-stranded-DNA-specific exonuclease
LLQRGIAVMRTSSRIGLNKLIEYAKLNPTEIDESEIGFGLGPRLNAQGRLGDAAEAVELLATSDAARAAVLANQLEGMNAQRKLESSFVQASAESLLENDPTLLNYAVIVLSHAEWKGGVVGIVANRLADKYNKPVVMLCEENDVAFGSARSVIGINITDAIKSCREILNKFGGHAMAAGVSLNRKNIGEFRRMLSRTVRAMLPDTETEPVLEIDGELQLSEISMELVQDVRRLAPFGNGNPPLNLVTRNVHIARKKKLGKSGENYEIIIEDETGNRQRVHWWNAGELPKVRFDLAYNLNIDRFGKAPEVVLSWRDFQPLEAEQIEIITNNIEYEIIDCRSHPTPRKRLEETLIQFSDAVIWSESDKQIGGKNRTELLPSENFIVWTVPAGTQEWQEALEIVKPKRIIIFGQTPTPLSVEMFLSKLGGVIKYAINSKGGRVKINAMAAALAQRAEAIKQGLKWYEAAGQLGIDWLPRGEILILQKADEVRPQVQSQLENLLKNILAETEIYRTSEYFKTR